MQEKIDKSSKISLKKKKKEDMVGSKLKNKLSKSMDSLKVVREDDEDNGDIVDHDDDSRSGNNIDPSKKTTRGSSASSSSGNLPTGFRFTKRNNDSPAFLQALSHVKDFMTDIQKGHILLREAKLLMETGDYKTTIDVLNEGINLNPNPSLFNARATCYKMLDMFNEAYFDYSYMIRLQPEDGSHFCSRGLCLSKLKKYSLALEDMDTAVELDPTPTHYFSRASVLAESTKFLAAIEDYNRAIRDLGNSNTSSELKLKCCYKRAQCYFELRNYDKVVLDCNTVLAIDPNSVAARMLMGRSLKLLNEYQKAEEQLTNAIILDENQAALYTERGDLRFRTGLKNKIIESIYDFDKAVKLLESKVVSQHSRSQEKDKGGNALPAFYFNEIVEQLSDTYFKRAQAKLILVTSENETTNVEAALNDSLKALYYTPNDDEMHMMVASCYIKLGRFEDASLILLQILERTPNNAKALYNFSFCQRASGEPKNAIEGLTKILAQADPELNTILNTTRSANLSLPIERVYEMRGTMFHEIQAHKLALSDLGKAIAINPYRADNFFLRADCHCKGGNYEQAIADYNLAEEKGFEDLCSLCIARGSIYRLLGQSLRAGDDFDKAFDMIHPDDKMTRIRVLSFKAFCLIDQSLYSDSYSALVTARNDNQDILNSKLKEHGNISVENVEPEFDPRSTYSDYISKKIPPLTELQSEILYIRKLEFFLNYHIALSLYMMKQYVEAEEIILICISDENRRFIPDDLSLGALYYFLGLSYIELFRYDLAKEFMLKCSKTHWVDMNKNNFLYHYSIAKLFQIEGNHSDALNFFNIAVSLVSNNPYCYFRRAWSHKALGDFKSAGEDFETAKSIVPGDPNFAIDYKRIAAFQYMIISTEPDLVEKFPMLLPNY